MRKMRGAENVAAIMSRTPAGTEPVSFRCDRKLVSALYERGAQLGIKTQRGIWERAISEWMLFSLAKEFSRRTNSQ
jgi:hypothetical protein